MTDLTPDRTRAVLTAQVEEYAELSARYAARGDARRAALALWASDIRVVQSVLEAGAQTSADVDAALSSRQTPPAGSVRDVVEGAREALLAVFDEPLRGELAGRLTPIDHLDDVPAPGPGAANQAVAERLDGRSGEQLVSDLLLASSDCRAVAELMDQLGDDEEARRQLDSADLAGFEAYLVLASAASGDATLATTELRWDLAATRGGSEELWGAGRRRSAHVDSTVVRDAVRAVIVPAEEQALLSVIGTAEPVPVVG
jgi:hypothetical protein